MSRKPFHWKNEAEENRAILSAVALTNPQLWWDDVFLTELSEDERDSLIWGFWEDNKKKLRPQIYKTMRLVGKVLERIIKRVKR